MAVEKVTTRFESKAAWLQTKDTTINGNMPFREAADKWLETLIVQHGNGPRIARRIRMPVKRRGSDERQEISGRSLRPMQTNDRLGPKESMVRGSSRLRAEMV